MSGFDHLEPHGVIVRPGFLEPDACRRLREAASAARAESATITRNTGEVLVEERTRRTRRAVVPEECGQLLGQRLAPVARDLAERFGLAIDALQLPQFLVYGRGDFFRPHQDSSRDARAMEEIRLRRISLVVFLNAQTPRPEPDCFCGGALTFLRLTPDVDALRTPVPAQEGTLVAFRSDLWHEVTPVTHGERHTAVTWLLGPEEEA